MKKNSNTNMYEGLASCFLPAGVLDYFEVTDFAEESTDDKNVLYSSILHIYLDERDNRTPDMAGSVSNGFGRESCLADFPAREKKFASLDNKIQLRQPGTRYSKDIVLFFNRADGQ